MHKTGFLISSLLATAITIISLKNILKNLKILQSDQQTLKTTPKSSLDNLRLEIHLYNKTSPLVFNRLAYEADANQKNDIGSKPYTLEINPLYGYYLPFYETVLEQINSYAMPKEEGIKANEHKSSADEFDQNLLTASFC